jgi:HlyD family secretion protein
MSVRWVRVRFWFTTLVGLLMIAGAAAGVYHFRQVQASVTLPVAPARKGDFLVIIRCRGELRARHSVQIYAPIVPGLRIAWLAPSGEPVKPGDLLIKFDSSQAQQQLMQKEAQLRQSEAAVDQAVAQNRIVADQDKTDLADSKFTVERARLQADMQEVKSRIEGESSKIDLGVAQQKLKVQEATVTLHEASNNSKMASLTRQRDVAKADVEITKSRIGQMEIKSPIEGFLVFMNNYSQGGLEAKVFKVGDNVFAGMVLAEIPDLNTLELEAKIEETDRGRITANQEVKVRVDALPELTIPAKVAGISPLAEQSTNEYPPTRSFRAYAAILHPDPRLRPGMNGGMDIVVSRIPNAISIPAKALFTRAGKPVVYLAVNGQYRATEVQVLARNPDELAISGIPSGSMVTLVDAEKKDQKK